MQHIHAFRSIAAVVALTLMMIPGTAFAEAEESQATAAGERLAATGVAYTEEVEPFWVETEDGASNASGGEQGTDEMPEAQVKPAPTAKKLDYDPALIEEIGTQEQTGHTICCPSFSCAYADAVMDGTVHDHEYYSCSCCTWTDWGGGGSWDRCVGSDEELLREAYDQITDGKPTVIHVTGNTAEHWIALIGYEGAEDPDHLELSNFIALDPWDGVELNAAERFSLYGDGCEHISDR